LINCEQKCTFNAPSQLFIQNDLKSTFIAVCMFSAASFGFHYHYCKEYWHTHIVDLYKQSEEGVMGIWLMIDKNCSPLKRKLSSTPMIVV